MNFYSIFMVSFFTGVLLNGMDRPQKREFQFTPRPAAVQFVQLARRGIEPNVAAAQDGIDHRASLFLDFYYKQRDTDFQFISYNLNQIINDPDMLQALLLLRKKDYPKEFLDLCDDAVYLSAGMGFVDVLRFFISNGYDIDRLYASGENALHRAIRRGRLGVVEFLVGEGAGVNTLTRDGRHPLDVEINEVDSVASPKEKIIQCLVASGAMRISDQTGQMP